MATPISGFTVIRNARLMGYPVLESIRSLLPMVDEFVIGLGQSDDDTRELLRSLDSPKIRIFDSFWDTSKTKGGLVLSEKTNEALAQCKNDWCFYIQADEVVHEHDLPVIQNAVNRAAANPEIEGLLFRYIHFYGSYSTVATSRRWYRNEVRVVRRSSGAQSVGDAQSFRVDGRKPRVLKTDARIFHYGWVKPPKVMGQKSKLLNRWWHGNKRDNEFENFEYAKQYGLKHYTGPHPEVMKDLIRQQDWTFDPNRQLSDWTLKDVNLWASDLLEAVTGGYRIGEYRPYKVVALDERAQ
ncbi:MAG: hypothetical protein RBT63_03665 [Bdellovibrionales bacterium]|jgi:hypothetical protein|nr:hypothetical protein [Bdellovibrionales bacterium]